jgi:hypothetical protein
MSICQAVTESFVTGLAWSAGGRPRTAGPTRSGSTTTGPPTSASKRRSAPTTDATEAQQYRAQIPALMTATDQVLMYSTVAPGPAGQRPATRPGSEREPAAHPQPQPRRRAPGAVRLVARDRGATHMPPRRPAPTGRVLLAAARSGVAAVLDLSGQPALTRANPTDAAPRRGSGQASAPYRPGRLAAPPGRPP